LIDEIVRDGARRMLDAALEAEVAAYIAAQADQIDERGRRLVVRNGPRAAAGRAHQCRRGGGGRTAGQ
jgi:putative transposase